MFEEIQHVPDHIGEEASLKGNRVEVGHGITGANGWKEDIAYKGSIIAKEQDKDATFQFVQLASEIENRDQGHRNEIITSIGKGHEVGEPGNNPSLHPEGGMSPKDEVIDLNQPRVDIRLKMLNEVSKGFIDENHE